jgi:hypothetical protein
MGGPRAGVLVVGGAAGGSFRGGPFGAAMRLTWVASMGSAVWRASVATTHEWLPGRVRR